MTTYCQERRDSLLEAALSGAVDSLLQEHIQHCQGCRRELDALLARRTRMDAALPLIVQNEDAGPQPEFHARVMQAAAQQEPRALPAVWAWLAVLPRRWAFTLTLAIPALAAATIAAVLVTQKPHTNRISEDTMASATRLANWQSPTAALLETPGQELLRSTPRLGESYLNFSTPTQQEKRQ
ncbi:MAG TPA: hypothetical protein VNW97_04085 [Candidatus Saccharimonadales bacterium]|jgi:hypothetical protein|nr:hypothetical protein [Candidatus Saccharimonadales bacterium]